MTDGRPSGDLPAGTQIRDYVIVRLLGRGAMGEVYLADDLRHGRPVALKLPHAGLLACPGYRQRLHAEGWLAAGLRHPSICEIYEVGEDAGQPFVAMEYVSGPTLDERAADRPFEPEEIVRLGIEIADGLDEARRQRVIHRDLKCRNIALTEDGHVRILDFGLARQEAAPGGGPGVRDPGTPIGTTACMSPEQVLGRTLDHRSDLFSLGVVLYELIAGRTPFGHLTGAELLRAILNDPAPPLDTRGDATLEALARVVHRLLEQDRQDRYQTGGEVAADLGRINAPPPPPDPVAVRRHWFNRLAGSATGVVVAVGFLFPATVILADLAGEAVRARAADLSGIWIGGPGEAAPSPVLFGTADPAALWIGNDGRLVYGSAGWRGRRGIWTFAPGDAEPRLVTGDGEQPAVSPDGRFIVFARATETGLFQMAFDGGPEPIRVFDRSASLAAVAPDADTVYFRRGRTGTLWELSLANGGARELRDVPVSSRPMVSPDGRALAFQSGKTLLVCALPGCTEERRLPLVDVHAWMPDGRGLAYAGAPGRTNLWKAPLDGGRPHQITFFSSRALAAAAWSPDGRHLALARVPTVPELAGWKTPADVPFQPAAAARR